MLWRHPPDPTGAIGPDYYLEFTNQSVGVFSAADLSQVAVVGHDNFMGGTGGGERVGFHFPDPQIQWDPAANRWLFASVGLAGNPQVGFTFLLAFGWSKTADPLPLATSAEGPGNWCRFYIDTGNELEDFPKLGHNDNHLIIGTNVFEEEGALEEASVEGFLTARIWAIPKPANGDTSCTPPAVFSTGTTESPLETADGDMAFTPVPANTFEGAANGYVVAADSPFLVENPSQVMAWHLSGAAEAPTLSADGNMDVGAFDFPANVPQPESTSLLDSLDARLTQAVARTDPAVGEPAVWTQHTVDGSEGRSVVRWYELLPQSSVVRQEGTISDPSNFAFNAAISPSSDGAGAAINYNLGGGSQLMQIRARSRQATTPLDQMVGEVLLREGADAYPCGHNPCRWGDYAGASPDPASTSLVWGTNYTRQLSGAETRNFALSVEGVPPDTSIDSGPSDPTNVNTPTFTFSSTKQGSSFECRSDLAFFRACSGPGDSDTPTSQLPDGPHTFEVRATDTAGITDPSPASRSFTVDTQAPATQIDSGPSGPTNDDTPTFEFSSSEQNVDFECSLGGGFSPCSSPHTTGQLADGSYSLSVRATDPAGNIGPAAEREFTVDTQAPATQIDSGPSGPTNDDTPTFEFSSSEQNVDFECSLGGGFSPCSSPHTTGQLADGSYSLSVRATDPAGNIGPAAEREFTVDTQAPATQIDSGPSGPTNDDTPTFEFSSSEQNVDFECSLGGGFSPCSSPHTTGQLADGSYSLSVRATDPAGNIGPAAEREFTVDTQAPATQIDSGPSGPTNDDTPTFEFSSSEQNVDFECSLGGGFSPCSSPHTTGQLADGSYSLSVRATDPAGNIGPAAEREFTVDTIVSVSPPRPTVPDGTVPGLDALLADTQPPDAKLTVTKRQAAGRPIEIEVSCAESCTVLATGMVVAFGRTHRRARISVSRGHKARFGLRKVARRLSAGQAASLRLRLRSRKAWRRLKRLVRRGRKARAGIRVKFTDRAGNSKIARQTIRLRR